MNKLTDDQRSYLALNGYEYLDGKYCYAKVGGNIAIQQSQDSKFYMTITKGSYVRGLHYNIDGVFIGYFDDLQELLSVAILLSKYKIH